LQQKAAEVKAKAAAVNAKIENAKKELDKAKAQVEKAKATLKKATEYWDKMKEKLPDFSKGADLLQQYLPKLPEVASIATAIKAFPAIDSIANASQVVNAFSSSIPNSFENASFNNVFTSDATSSATNTGAVKSGSVSVSASGGGGMGVVNGDSRIGTVNVQKVIVSLPDMSDKNPNEPKKQNNNTVAPQPANIKPVGSKPDSVARKQAIELAIAKNKAEREMKLAAKKLQQQVDNEADRKKVESLRREAEEKMLKKALDDKSKKDGEHKKQISEGTHAILSGLGFIPGAGTIAGVLDTSLYAIEGDWTNAGISALAMIPVFGSIAKIGVKNGKKVLEISEEGLHQLINWIKTN
jgi:hypothetical protein